MPFAEPNFAILAQRTRTSIPLIAGISGFESEEHEVNMRATHHPVESGAPLTDNAILEPQKIRLNGRVTDLLPKSEPGEPSRVWNRIIQLARTRELVTVHTDLHTYRNMLIQKAVAPVNRRTGRSLVFRLELAEVLTTVSAVDALTAEQTVSQPQNPDNMPAADRTSIVDRGTVASVPVSTVNDELGNAESTIEEAREIADTSGKFRSVKRFTGIRYALSLLSDARNHLNSGRTGSAVSSFAGAIGELDAIGESTRVGSIRTTISSAAKQVRSLRSALIRSPVDSNPLQITVREAVSLSGDARSTFRTAIGNQNVRIRNWWQPSDRNWYATFSRPDGSPITTGVRLVDADNVLAGRSTPGFEGQIGVEGDGIPGRDSWGTTHRLVYAP